MKNEYIPIHNEYGNAFEFYPSAGDRADTKQEYFSCHDEFWKEEHEYADGTKKDTGLELQDRKSKAEKEAKKRSKFLRKMVYGIASAVAVVMISQTIEPTTPVVTPGTGGQVGAEDVIVISGEGILTAEQVSAEVAQVDGSFRVIIEDGIEAIGQKAFFNYSGLIGVEIPDSVTGIGNKAFADCDNLMELEIPDSVTHIGDEAFVRCNNLEIEKVSTEDRVMGGYAFNGVNIHKVVLSDNMVLGGMLGPFRGAIVDTVSFEEGITQIPGYTFCYSKIPATIQIPEGVTEIEGYAFYGCEGLTNIEIPDSVTEIGDEAFTGCSGLTKVEIPDSVMEIGFGAFDDCDNLELVVSSGSAAESYAIEEGIAYTVR